MQDSVSEYKLLPWLDHALAEFYQHGLVIIPSAISTELCERLLENIRTSVNFQPAGVGRHQQHHQNNDIRRDQTCWLDGGTPAQQEYLHILEILQRQVNRRCFLGLTHYESHFARYQQGDFYQKHVDAFKGRSNRVLTTVCYLNTVDQGGELLIYNDNDDILHQVTPEQGTLVMFESERFPHEVSAAQTTRYSIAGWFRND